MIRFANETVNAEANALARRLDGGFLRIYAGNQPTSADAPVTAQTLLAELKFADPSSGPAINGVLSFDLAAENDAKATGLAAWFRAVSASGETVMDGEIDDGVAINVATIQIHARVSADSWTLAVAKE